MDNGGKKSESWSVFVILKHAARLREEGAFDCEWSVTVFNDQIKKKKNSLSYHCPDMILVVIGALCWAKN